MGYVFLVFAIIIGLIVYGNYVAKDNTENIKLKVDKLERQYDKAVVLGYERNENTLNFIGFDNSTKQMTIKTKGQQQHTINYSDIANAELIENGKSVLNLESIITGTVLLGNVGALLGGMDREYKVTSKAIKLTTNDFNNTTKWINLLDNGTTVSFIPNIKTDTEEIISTIKHIMINR